MKYIIVTIMLLFTLSLHANAVEYIRSDKLRITGDPANPDSLQRHYYGTMMGIEPVNNITVEFDINDVVGVNVIDMNALNNKCGKKKKHELFYLVFSDPEKNHKKIKSRINGPCLVEREAVLKLRVRTSNEKYYDNIIKLRSLHHHIKSESRLKL